MKRIKTTLLIVFLLSGTFAVQAQNWTPWTPLNYTSVVSASVSFLIVNDCKNFNYSFYRTNNNTYSKNGTLTFSFNYDDCDGKQQLVNAIIDLSKTGIDQDKGQWFITGSGRIKDIKIEELYMPDKKVWVKRAANGVTIDEWKLHYGGTTQKAPAATVALHTGSLMRPATPSPVANPKVTQAPPVAAAGPSSSNEAIARMQAQQQNVSVAVGSIGNSIWDLIQSGKAKKAGAIHSIIASYAASLYDTKVNADKFYVSFSPCDHCNGTGITPGDSYPCSYCSGSGKYYALKDYYLKCLNNDPENPKMAALVQYLNHIQPDIQNFDQANPLYEFKISGYNGTVDLKNQSLFFSIGNYLVIQTTYKFDFTKKNGKQDLDALFTRVDDYKVMPLDEIVGIKFINGETTYAGEEQKQSFNRYILTTTSGDSIEFISNETDIENTVSGLIEAAKN